MMKMKLIDKEILNDLERKRQRLFDVRKPRNRQADRRYIQLTDKIDEMTRKRMKGRRKPEK